ncbi:MAG TPA: alpha/beta hydrolase [Methanoregula sp.]|nr:alpha/beta hydrolase [Methanoregula sp.]
MNYALDDELLLIRGKQSFLLVAKIKNRFGLCIETTLDEYCQGVESGDLVVVSAPEDGAIEPALMLIDLVRTFHVPLLVLPKDHPGSKRISYVVSVGPEIFTSCSIQRGTHPDQHLICSSDELAGITLKRSEHGVDVYPLPGNIIPRNIKYEIKTDVS